MNLNSKIFLKIIEFIEENIEIKNTDKNKIIYEDNCFNIYCGFNKMLNINELDKSYLNYGKIRFNTLIKVDSDFQDPTLKVLNNLFFHFNDKWNTLFLPFQQMQDLLNDPMNFSKSLNFNTFDKSINLLINKFVKSLKLNQEEMFDNKIDLISEIEKFYENLSSRNNGQWFLQLINHFGFDEEIKEYIKRISIKTLIDFNRINPGYKHLEYILKSEKIFNDLPNVLKLILRMKEINELVNNINLIENLFNIKIEEPMKNGKIIFDNYLKNENFSKEWIECFSNEKNNIYKLLRNRNSFHDNNSIVNNNCFYIIIYIVNMINNKKAIDVLDEFFFHISNNKSFHNKSLIKIKTNIDQNKFNELSGFCNDLKLNYDDVNWSPIDDSFNQKYSNFWSEICIPIIEKSFNEKNINYDKTNLFEFKPKNQLQKNIINFFMNNLEKSDNCFVALYRFIYQYIETANYAEMKIGKLEKVNSDNDPFEIILDSFDGNEIIKKLKKNHILKKLNLDNFNPIAFCSNNLLSRKNILLFSEKEQEGDLLYSLIIYNLQLEGKIKFDVNDLYKSAIFQNRLFEYIFDNDIIQDSHIYFGKLSKFEDADYLEAFIGFCMSDENSYLILKEIIFNAIKEKIPQIVFSDKKNDWLLEESNFYYENFNNDYKGPLLMPSIKKDKYHIIVSTEYIYETEYPNRNSKNDYDFLKTRFINVLMKYLKLNDQARYELQLEEIKNTFYFFMFDKLNEKNGFTQIKNELKKAFKN